MTGHPNQVQLSAVSRARMAWGPQLPDWIERLAIACDRESQARIARRIQYSPATLSHVLRRAYPGDVAAVEAAVRRGLMSEAVTCPVLGEISGADCLAHQRAPYQSQNPQRVALYAACRSCANRIEGRKSC